MKTYALLININSILRPDFENMSDEEALRRTYEEFVKSCDNDDDVTCNGNIMDLSTFATMCNDQDVNLDCFWLRFVTLEDAVTDRIQQSVNRETVSIDTVESYEEEFGEDEEFTECCPNCEEENTMEWNILKNGWKFYCPKCGCHQHCCDICQHASDNQNGFCDFDKDTQECYRDRQWRSYKELEETLDKKDSE